MHIHHVFGTDHVIMKSSEYSDYSYADHSKSGGGGLGVYSRPQSSLGIRKMADNEYKKKSKSGLSSTTCSTTDSEVPPVGGTNKWGTRDSPRNPQGTGGDDPDDNRKGKLPAGHYNEDNSQKDAKKGKKRSRLKKAFERGLKKIEKKVSQEQSQCATCAASSKPPSPPPGSGSDRFP